MKPSNRPLVVLAVAALVGIGLSTAVYATVDDDKPEAAARAPLETDGLSLVEIAQAATPEPGEVLPPCPDAETVAKLKEAKINFGPCDPFPEVGEQMVYPENPQPNEDAADPVRCVEVAADRGGTDLSYELPCGKGLEILEENILEYGGEKCTEVVYIPEKGAEARTDIFCGGVDHLTQEAHSH